MAGMYLDSSAIVKLAVYEPESTALRKHLRRRRPLVSSALARVEVLRALLPGADEAQRAGRQVLATLDLVRMNNRVLNRAGALPPAELRSLDAIHLATAMELQREIKTFVTYDERLALAARDAGFRVVAPL
jgi:predicted nucleic acid-binding protein